jgi:hypothetical protein
MRIDHDGDPTNREIVFRQAKECCMRLSIWRVHH